MTDPLLGEIRSISFNYAPKGWAFCNGQTLNIGQNSALYSLIGTTYGGDGITTFKLPNLQGRVPVGAGPGPGLQNYSLGQTGGVETVTLTASQMPMHTHVVAGTIQAGGPAEEISPEGNYPGSGARTMYSNGPKNAGLGTPNALKGQTSVAGSGQPHDNRQPYLATYYVIAVAGVYPQRP